MASSLLRLNVQVLEGAFGGVVVASSETGAPSRMRAGSAELQLGLYQIAEGAF